MKELYHTKSKEKRVHFISQPLIFADGCGMITVPNEAEYKELTQSPRGKSTLLPFPSDLRSVKTHSTRTAMVTCSSFVYGLCLATIGVAFFGAVTSVAALFIFFRKKERK